MPETLRDKIVRHVKAGQFDLPTLGRGVKTAFGHYLSRNEDRGVLEHSYTIDGYMGIPGMSLTHYDFQRRLKGMDYFLEGVARLYPAEYKVFKFPKDSKIQPVLTSEDQMFHTKDILDQYPEAIATFTGPTFHSYVGLPNNGFYYRPEGEMVPFAETNPPGGRRGAVTISDQLNPVIIDDRLKWALRDAEYPEIKAMFGTSNFFSGFESEDDIVDPDTGKNNGSYLFQYLNRQGDTEMGFMVSAWIGARRTMKRVLDDFVSRQNGQGYFAVELELASAQCVTRGPHGRNVYGNGFSNRFDHYLVVPASKAPENDEVNEVLHSQMRCYFTRSQT